MTTPSPVPAGAFDAWIGRSESRRDVLGASPVARMAATLDRADLAPTEASELPPLWHWLYFLPDAPGAELGEDGHPRRGGFLPPITLPRRMWAGSRITFHAPLHIGEPVERSSRITAVEPRSGKSGPLVFLKLTHHITGPRGLAITEEQDIVYREAAPPGAPAAAKAPPAPEGASFSRRITPTATLLFRFSALTFNAHRIHYDRDYATRVEGYPALVVHGPLIATLLLDLVSRERPDARVLRFDFKAVSPLFDDAAFEVCARDDGAKRLSLWAQNAAGDLAMQAAAELA
ncbi:MAG: MaoC family dehydratase N-terminal domain-containing protein [Rubrivivax sp.]